jgi:hypothetical protein
MKREALVPIDEEVRDLIGEQQVRVGVALCLFPRQTKNPDGRAPVGSGTYRQALYRWLDVATYATPTGNRFTSPRTNGAILWNSAAQPGRAPRGCPPHP